MNQNTDELILQICCWYVSEPRNSHLIQMSHVRGKVFRNVCRTSSHFHSLPLTLFIISNLWAFQQRQAGNGGSRSQDFLKFNFMDDNNSNVVTAEIWLKIISLIYSTPWFSRDVIPPEVALLKFEDGNNMYRMEWRGAVSLRQTGRIQASFLEVKQVMSKGQVIFDIQHLKITSSSRNQVFSKSLLFLSASEILVLSIGF